MAWTIFVIGVFVTISALSGDAEGSSGVWALFGMVVSGAAMMFGAMYFRHLGW